MFIVTHNILEITFAEINRILFFSQLDLTKVDLNLEKLTTEYSYCFKELSNIEFGITNEFIDESHFRFVLMYEMIRLYRYQVCNEEPRYDSLFSILEYHGLKKVSNLSDPDEAAIEDA